MSRTDDGWTPEQAELHRVALGIHEHEVLFRGGYTRPEYDPTGQFLLWQAAASWIWSYEPQHEAARDALRRFREGGHVPDVPSLPPRPPAWPN